MIHHFIRHEPDIWILIWKRRVFLVDVVWGQESLSMSRIHSCFLWRRFWHEQSYLILSDIIVHLFVKRCCQLKSVHFDIFHHSETERIWCRWSWLLYTLEPWILYCSKTILRLLKIFLRQMLKFNTFWYFRQVIIYSFTYLRSFCWHCSILLRIWDRSAPLMLLFSHNSFHSCGSISILNLWLLVHLTVESCIWYIDIYLTTAILTFLYWWIAPLIQSVIWSGWRPHCCCLMSFYFVNVSAIYVVNWFF